MKTVLIICLFHACFYCVLDQARIFQAYFVAWVKSVLPYQFSALFAAYKNAKTAIAAIF